MEGSQFPTASENLEDVTGYNDTQGENSSIVTFSYTPTFRCLIFFNGKSCK